MGLIKKFSQMLRAQKVNKSLVPIKVQYLIFFAALGCALPFRTLLVKQIGLSGAAIGVIFTFVPFMKIVTNPLFGAISDYFKKFRATIIILLIFVAISHVNMIFVPPILPSPNAYILQTKINYTCDDRLSKPYILNSHLNIDISLLGNISCRSRCFFDENHDHELCEERDAQEHAFLSLQTLTYKTSTNDTETILASEMDFVFNSSSLTTDNKMYYNISCFCGSQAQCSSDICNEMNTKEFVNVSETTENEFISFQFWCLFMLMSLTSSTFAAVIFLMDAVCYEILDNQPEKYGQQRLWGTIGWGIGTVLGGYANDLATGDALTVNYAPCFYLLAALCLLNSVPIFFVKVENIKYSKNIFKDVCRLLCNGYVLQYVVMVFFVGVLSGLIWNYQLWFMEEIGASPLLQGLSMTAECFLAELPCFIIAGWVIKKIGHNHCTSITFLCFGLRYLCFAYMEDPWLSIPVAFLHGPTFGIFFASMTAFAKENAPSGTEATVQGLLSVSFEGMGVGAGSFLGGLAFDTLGSRATLWYFGIGSFVCLVINILLGHCTKHLKNKSIPVATSQNLRYPAHLSNVTNFQVW